MEIARETYALRRQRVLNEALQKGAFDVLCVTDERSVRYLTGLTEGCHHVLLSRDGDLMLTNVMFHDRVALECPDMEQARISVPIMDSIRTILHQRGWMRVALIDASVTVSEWRAWKQIMGAEALVAIPDVVADCRMIKDAEEIEIIRRAITVAENAFLQFIERGASFFIGKEEQELALELEILMRRSGAEDQAFPNGVILASGPNSYKAHYRPSNRKVQQDDIILIDWGAVVDGYCSDLTRVIAVGAVSDTLQSMHRIVNEAHVAAISAMRAGINAEDVDAVARQIVAAAGYPAEAFRHGLGHSLGLAVHEPPYMTKGVTTPLEAGMILTVEPGLYVDGIGGVRLERDVLITETGADDMGSLPIDWFTVD